MRESQKERELIANLAKIFARLDQERLGILHVLRARAYRRAETKRREHQRLVDRGLKALAVPGVVEKLEALAAESLNG